jgi:hypothetical protein
VSVGYIKWNRNGLCGAACAHMVLHPRYLMGTTEAEQENVWNRIKANTNGRLIPACSGVVPELYSMIREVCGKRVACWETHPDALIATLRDMMGGTPVVLQRAKNQDAANNIIKGCLGAGGVPIVLVQSGKHWVIVDEWDPKNAKPVRVLDPAPGRSGRFKVSKWNVRFMSAVDCGAFDREYLVVEVGP